MALIDFLQLRSVGRTFAELETPVPIIDIDIVERNVRRWQQRCDALKLANRPHIKTHKITGLARYQVAEGAKGITVQKLGEAEVMVDAGLDDMLLTFNVVGAPKLARLAKLMQRAAMTVVADNEVVVEGLGHAARSAGRTLSVLVECDSGAGRNGVQTAAAALALAQRIDRTQGLHCAGLMTYPAAGKREATGRFLTETRDLFKASGLVCEVISSGGSPDMWSDEGLAPVTEYRVGTYVYFDRSLVVRKACDFSDCALTVLSTVVSRPTAERAIIDAGTKALTSDMLDLGGYGVLHDQGDAKIYAANEEHGFVDTSGDASALKVGELVRIVPNHVCPVSNLFDEVVFVRGQEVLGAAKVDARGKVY